MTEHKVNRKQILAGAGAAGIAAALAGPTRALAAGDSRLTGTWLITVKESGLTTPTPDLSLLSLAAGGVLVSVGARDQQAGNRGSVQIGVWEANGDNFRAKFLQFALNDSGNPIGIIHVRPMGERDPDSDTLHGTFTGDFRDLQGHVLQTFSGTLTGTRVSLEGED